MIIIRELDPSQDGRHAAFAEGGSFVGSTHLVVGRQPESQRTTAHAEPFFLLIGRIFLF